MADRSFQLSVLDRLIGTDLDERGFRVRSPERALALHRAAVRRDLHWLLNTRRILPEAPEDFPETRASLYHYGVPDPTSLQVGGTAARRTVQRLLKEAIEAFEPRLTQVRVVWVEPDPANPQAGETSYQARYRIEARLRIGDQSEAVRYDAVLDKVEGAFRVSGADDA